MPSLAATIVTFNPDIQTLVRLVEILINRAEKVILVDNGSAQETLQELSRFSDNPRVKLLLIGANLGVSAAHNLALNWAVSEGYTHAAMFDQDSLPDESMLDELMRVEGDLRAAGKHVAAIGPQYFDPRHLAPAPFIRLEGGLIRKICCSRESEIVPVDYLITSGTLIRLDVLKEVGMLDESLFIDYIDIEWCLRAKAKGFQSYGVCSAKMHHSLGDEVVSWRNGKRLISVRTPLRNYYLFRNAVLLYKRSYIPWVWIFNDAYRLLLKLGFFTLITPPRLVNLKMMTLGLLHGMMGRSGPYPR
ncbi:MAG: glycosyltransferase family 2 protein [Sulfuricella sp.]|nr:glycosyltransferase family 2 protein [Sulfuricella sp.]